MGAEPQAGPGMPQGAPAQGAPQGGAQPGQGAPQPSTPAEVAAARSHMMVMIQGLLGLAAQPKGALTKRSVFNAMGEMIAQGAFPTPQSKQQLVAQLAEMPDDEAAIRQIIGGHLLRLNEQAEQFAQHFGVEE